ncbi:MAG: hypothetical protein IKA48_00630 [Fibrobacter sp.]|nr:hypothetical protein [Fibrobacter sp.]
MNENDKINGMVNCAGTAKFYPGSGLPEVATEDYRLEPGARGREEIKGLKEFEVEPIKAGERFYIPLPWQLGGDMNEQKYRLGVALKDIPATKTFLKPYITGLFENSTVLSISTRKGYNLDTNLAGKLGEAKTEPEQHITRTQTLWWHDARKDIPEMNRVCLIKVPDRPWDFGGKGDIKQDVVYLDSRQVFNEGELPYVFRQFGPGTFDYNEVTEWAYLDE